MDFRRPLSVITPTLDGDVLTLLAWTLAAYTPGHLARVLPRGSVEGVRKCLNRLTDQGIVENKQVGRAVVYQLNTDHLAFEPLRALAKARWRLADALRDVVAAWPKEPHLVALFGSAARGEATTQSDIDLLVVWGFSETEETATCEEYLRVKAARMTGNDARIVSMTSTEFERSQSAGDPFVAELARDAVIIGGDEAWISTVLGR